MRGATHRRASLLTVLVHRAGLRERSPPRTSAPRHDTGRVQQSRSGAARTSGVVPPAGIENPDQVRFELLVHEGLVLPILGLKRIEAPQPCRVGRQVDRGAVQQRMNDGALEDVLPRLDVVLLGDFVAALEEKTGGLSAGQRPGRRDGRWTARTKSTRCSRRAIRQKRREGGRNGINPGQQVVGAIVEGPLKSSDAVADDLNSGE